MALFERPRLGRPSVGTMRAMHRVNDVLDLFRHPLPGENTVSTDFHRFFRDRYRLEDSKDDMKRPFATACLHMWNLNRNGNDEEKHLAQRANQTLMHILDAPPRTPIYTKEQKQVVQFLGFPDEPSFLQHMPAVFDLQIASLVADETDVPKVQKSIRALSAFVEEGYQPLPHRKSGESARCHALRVLYYTFDHLIRTGAQLSKADVIDIATISQMHDSKEDWGMPTRPLQQHTSNTDGITSHTYELIRPEEGSSSSHTISARAHAGIQALSYLEVDTDTRKFHHVVQTSPWSGVEIVKAMDRVDNMLTYGMATKSWWHYLYKMYESATLLNDLSITTRIAHASEDSTQHISQSRPGEILAYGMLMQGLHSVRTDLLHDLMLQNIPVRRHFNHLPESYHTWDDPIFPDVRNVLDACRARPLTPCVTTGDFMHVEAQVMAQVAHSVWEGAPIPGYGHKPFVRAMTNADRKQYAGRHILRSAQIAGAISGLMGAGGFLATHTTEMHPLHAMLMYTMGLGIGIGVTGTVFERALPHIFKTLHHDPIVDQG